MNLLPSTEPREPEVKRLKAPELRRRLMRTAGQIKEANSVKAIITKLLPDCDTKEWMISALDNRVVGLMEVATVLATALTGAEE